MRTLALLVLLLGALMLGAAVRGTRGWKPTPAACAAAELSDSRETACQRAAEAAYLEEGRDN